MHYNHEKPWRNNRDRLYSMQPNLETKSRSIGLHWFRRRKNGTYKNCKVNRVHKSTIDKASIETRWDRTSHGITLVLVNCVNRQTAESIPCRVFVKIFIFPVKIQIDPWQIEKIKLLDICPAKTINLTPHT